MSVDGIGRQNAAAIRAATNSDWARTQLRRTIDAGHRVVTLSDPDYPPLLRQIDAPPPVLWVTGNLTPLASESPAVAMVGSRNPSDYGRLVAPRLAGDLASEGVAVVSGMARGIDALCHGGALENGAGSPSPFEEGRSTDPIHRRIAICFANSARKGL